MNRFFFSHPDFFSSFSSCVSNLKSTMTKPECVLTDSVAYLRFLGRNTNCGGWGFHFGCELLGWAWWSEWLLFGRDFHWWFALQPFVSLFILFLHHGQFGAGFDRDRVLLLGRRTYDILWHAASSRAWTAFFGKCGECWFFVRAFTSLDEHKYERYIKTATNNKSEHVFVAIFALFFSFESPSLVEAPRPAWPEFWQTPHLHGPASPAERNWNEVDKEPNQLSSFGITSVGFFMGYLHLVQTYHIAISPKVHNNFKFSKGKF